jgi:hypothetical protein
VEVVEEDKIHQVTLEVVVEVVLVDTEHRVMDQVHFKETHYL